jgi:hypothetical protein
MRRDMEGHLRSAFHPERLPIASRGRQGARPSSKPVLENSCLLYAYRYSKAIRLQLSSLVGKANAWQGALVRDAGRRISTIMCSAHHNTLALPRCNKLVQQLLPPHTRLCLVVG